MPGTPFRRRSALALVAACATFAALTQTAPASPTASIRDEASADAVPGEILVRFEPGVGTAARAAARERVGVTLKRRLPLPGLELVHAPPGAQTRAALAALNAAPGVRYAEPNWLRHAEALPNDPRFGDQWGLLNTGQAIEGVPGAAGADISATDAWDVTTGSRNVKVAVIDNGIVHYHPDLGANIWNNPGEAASGEERNGLDDDHNGYVDDLHGWNFDFGDADTASAAAHGSEVASVIGATADNAIGMTGIDPHVSLVALRAGGKTVAIDKAIEAINYADRIGAAVANMSFGGSGSSAAEHDAIAAASDTLFVAAAGNDADDDDSVSVYPCDYDLVNVICVAATNNRDELASWSSYGASSVDLAAPGEGILVTSLRYREPFSDDFEGTTARWDYTEAPTPPDPAKWRRVVVGSVGGGGSTTSTHVLTDSEQSDYPANADTRVTLNQPIDLSGERGCSVVFQAVLDTESSKDHLRLEAARSHDGPYRELTRVSGSTAGARESFDAPLGDLNGGDVYLRFRLTSDAVNNRGGASVDDVTVLCNDPQQSYGFNWGTSFAAPQVTGAAALVKTYMPSLSVAALRERILRTVDPLPSLQGKTVTGGRLNVARALTADLDAPAISITRRPPDLAASGSAEFRFSSTEQAASFECSLDDGAFAACGSPKSYDGLADGGHTFAVRALDSFGNASQPAQAAWTIDTAAPGVTITAGPPDPTTDRAASFAFSASEPAEAFECGLDGGAFGDCSSPASYSSLPAGQHSFSVRARDTAGNWTAPPAAWTWTITGTPAGDPGDDTNTSLRPPDPGDAASTAWSPPELTLKVPHRQTVAGMLRRGLKTVATTAARCPCRLVYRLRLNARLARTLGLIGKRAATAGRMPTIGRAERSLTTAGRIRTRVRLSNRARERLANVTRVRMALNVKLTDRYARTAHARRGVRLR